ncbi:hypothetical protein C2S53_019171 [Perilla frutescens var. hirtella]|uniref:Protein FAR1-RELATED SEQUENCE n=1 Tax=Perilla frutescens var. hirtella TaxID=608512 RepID=A0AAD4JQC4_PERFH|nr:hypothetical protein C2S53_019171 [Perilla frutescens var. hirtella]
MEIDLNVPLGPEIGESESSTAAGDGESIDSAVNVYEKRLSIGSIVKSVESAYLLYCEYARLVGFSMRKGPQNYFRKSSEVRMKSFLCHCEGKPDCKRSTDRIANYRKQQRRTGCLARLRIIRTLEGPWRVSKFVKGHNHELVDPDQSYLLRSVRNLTAAKANVVEAFQEAGISISQSHRYMAKEAEGVQNVGFTKKDAYDHVRRVKMQSRLPSEDAMALHEYFQKKALVEPGFYWSAMLDNEGRFLNFFIRDTHSTMDYECFGDVLSVDTTFKTNKYDLICAPFVGINHHRSNVLFGIAFMSDETTASFEWLFQMFLDAMQEKEPAIIFFDQCQTLMNAIDCCFHSVSHRLCQWHVNQNAPVHF